MFSAVGRREILILNTSIHLRKRRFLTRMEEIPLFHQRGCIKTVTWRFSHISWRWVKKVRKIDELWMFRYKKMLLRQIM